MAKKTSKTSHVLSLLTSIPSNGEDTSLSLEPKNDQSGSDSLPEQTQATVTKRRNTQHTAHGALKQAQRTTPKQAERTYHGTPTEEGSPEELSEIIKAQLELLADKEEEEAAATVSSFHLEQFDADDEENSHAEKEDENMYHYANVVEDIVKIKVLETMKEMSTCTCEKCVSDVIAHALNHLPPKYVVTEKGNLFSKLSAYETQYSTDVTSAIVQACMVVNEHPRH